MTLWNDLEDVSRDGEAVAGFARVRLDLPHGKPLAGYSVGGSGHGQWTRNPMHARAMYLRGVDGEDVAVVAVDLMSASRYVHDAAARATATSVGIGRSRLILCGTHTHTGPGGFYGNSLYDTLASHDLMHGFDQALADLIAAAVAAAVTQAIANARPATVRVDVERVWGVSRNRSLGAFQRNEDHLLWNALPDMPGYGAPPGLSVEQQRVDPRVVVLSAYDAHGGRIGVFATFACHNTALGPRPTSGPSFYDPDWTGAAARILERRVDGAPVALVALSGAGDQTSLPAEGTFLRGPVRQGPERAEWVGLQIADAVTHANRHGAAGSMPPAVRVAHKDWWTEAHASGDPDWNALPGAALEAWCFGAPTLGGAEDGRSGFHPNLAREGMTSGHHPPGSMQHPKAPALGVLQAFIAAAGDLAPSPVHALHALRVNDHVFATVPGEPTVWAAYEIESAVLATVDAPGRYTASVIGYAGDYAGYFTTRGEFRAQHYEGSSTLFGLASTNHITERLRALVKQPSAASRALADEAPVAAPRGDLSRPPAGVAIPGPEAHAEAERVVATWCYPRGAAPTRFAARVCELTGDDARVELEAARVRAEPRDLQLGATPVSAWVVVADVDGSTSGRRFVVDAAGAELRVDGPAAPRGAAPVVARGALVDRELRDLSRFRAVVATWNSYGVPQAENLAVPFAPGSQFPARFRSTDLAMEADSPDVLCVQELIGTDARNFFDGLASYKHRMRRGGSPLGDHGLGVASRLAVEGASELRFASKALGADALICKGALHLRVRLTRGPSLDVVTTHLQAGGGAERALARASQLGELAEFIRKVSDPSRPLLLCGDFNVDGARPDRPEYLHFAQTMGSLALVDLDGELRRATANPHRNDLLRQLEPGAVPERLDYVFWRPAERDPFDLRIETVGLFLDRPLADLRALWHRVTGLDGEPFASDHFGLRLEVSYVPAALRPE